MKSNPATESSSTSDAGNSRHQARERAQLRILDAAIDSFAERGYAGTTVAQIATAAGVTKGLVHHYFGSKNELWEEVKELHGQTAAQSAAPRTADRGDMDGLTAWIERAFEFFRSEPRLLRMAAWAQIETDYTLPRSLLALEAEIDALFRDAQAQGVIRPDIDALNARALVHQLMAGWFQSRGLLCQAWGRDPSPPEIDDDYLRDMLAVVRRGLAPTPPTNERP